MMKNSIKTIVGVVLAVMMIAIASCDQSNKAEQQAPETPKDTPVSEKPVEKAAPAVVAGENTGDLEQLRAKAEANFRQAQINLTLTEVQETPMKGLYRALIEGGDSIFIDSEGKHFLSRGDMFEIQAGKVVNLSEIVLPKTAQSYGRVQRNGGRGPLLGFPSRGGRLKYLQ